MCDELQDVAGGPHICLTYVDSAEAAPTDPPLQLIFTGYT